MKKISVIILAAGKSTRMKSSKVKVLHSIAGRPIINYINDIAKKNSSSGIYYVCSKETENYIKKNFPESKTIIQKNKLGTAHAVQCTKNFIKKDNNDVIVLFGDVPLIKDSTIKKLIKFRKKSKTIGSIVAFKSNNPFGYGRVILKNGFIKSIVEHKNATTHEKKINLCNSGILICESKYLFSRLNNISNNKNNKKERYLTDLCELAFNEKKPFSFVECSETEVLGINSRKQLIELDLKFQKIIKDKLIKNGATLIQPETIRVSYDTILGKDVIIEPNCIIKKGVKINKSTSVFSGTYLEECSIGHNCLIGPSARIRPKTIIANNVKIGNFVEVKNSQIGENSSVAHLSYIGDTTIGKKVNIGAGTITCNYDGKNKNKTFIDDNSFIGSNSSLIAPIKIGKNVTIAAGSVIDKNVKSSNLAIERSKLLILSKKRRSKNS